jgi:hypothetical protein
MQLHLDMSDRFSYHLCSRVDLFGGHLYVAHSGDAMSCMLGIGARPNSRLLLLITWCSREMLWRHALFKAFGALFVRT